MNVSLVMFKSDGSRRDFPVTKPRIVVGRTNACDLRIPLSSVSRQHCEFRLEDDRFVVRDLGSSNGTFRNNDRINQETTLQAGDEIVIGPVVFTVVIDGQPDRISPVRTVVDRQGNDSSQGGQTTVEPQRVSFDTGVDMAGMEPEIDAQVDDETTPVPPIGASAGQDDDDEDDDFLPILDEEDEDLPTLDEEDEDLPILLDDDEDDDK